MRRGQSSTVIHGKASKITLSIKILISFDLAAVLIFLRFFHKNNFHEKSRFKMFFSSQWLFTFLLESINNFSCWRTFHLQLKAGACQSEGGGGKKIESEKKWIHFGGKLWKYAREKLEKFPSLFVFWGFEQFFFASFNLQKWTKLYPCAPKYGNFPFFHHSKEEKRKWNLFFCTLVKR